MRTKSYWLLDRRTKFCSGALREWAGIAGPKFSLRYGKCSLSFSQKSNLTYNHFTRCYQVASSASVEIQVLPLSFPLLLENWAWKSEGASFSQKRTGRAWGTPGAGGGMGNTLPQQEPHRLWLSREKPVGWRSSRVGSRMPGVRDASLHGYGVPVKSKQRAEADPRKQSCFSLCSCAEHLLRQIPQNCALPARQKQRFLHFLMFHQLQIRAIFWSSTSIPGSLKLDHPRAFWDSKTDTVELLSLNICQSPVSPGERGYFCTLTTSCN